MIQYSTANAINDLEGILKLQKANLARNLSAAESESQGFVTVDHSYELLKKLNDQEKHVIARAHDRVVGYVLAMTKQARSDIPVLLPMFDAFDRYVFRERFISDYNYIVVGQVCVDKAFRGQGVFDQCYAAYRQQHAGKYDLAITEIAASNTRSLRAHKRIGFEELFSYAAPDGSDWKVVLWDWNHVG